MPKRMLGLGWQVSALMGLATVVIGLLVTFQPHASLLTIAVLLGVLLIVSGIFQLVAAVNEEESGRVWRGIAGALFIVAGIVLIRHLHLSLAIIGLVVGITWVIQGAAAVIGGFSRDREARAWSVVFGVISVIAGIVVISTPVTALTTLAVLLGIWFIIMGVLELVDAFMIRRMGRQLMAAGGRAKVPGQRAGETAVAGPPGEGKVPAPGSTRRSPE
jgi:uncharacterized membrane protein HdeD (DUF308 family)